MDKTTTLFLAAMSVALVNGAPYRFGSDDTNWRSDSLSELDPNLLNVDGVNAAVGEGLKNYANDYYSGYLNDAAAGEKARANIKKDIYDVFENVYDRVAEGIIPKRISSAIESSSDDVKNYIRSLENRVENYKAGRRTNLYDGNALDFERESADRGRDYLSHFFRDKVPNAIRESSNEASKGFAGLANAGRGVVDGSIRVVGGLADVGGAFVKAPLAGLQTLFHVKQPSTNRNTSSGSPQKNVNDLLSNIKENVSNVVANTSREISKGAEGGLNAIGGVVQGAQDFVKGGADGAASIFKTPLSFIHELVLHDR